MHYNNMNMNMNNMYIQLIETKVYFIDQKLKEKNVNSTSQIRLSSEHLLFDSLLFSYSSIVFFMKYSSLLFKKALFLYANKKVPLIDFQTHNVAYIL